MIGAEGSAYLTPGQWQVTFSDRYQRSHRHFVGVNEQKRRRILGNEVVNNFNLFDLSATHAFSDRFNLTLSAPYLSATRSSGAGAARAAVSADGLGDLSVVGRWWVKDPKKNLDENLSLGFGLKVPSGEYGAKDQFTGGTPAVREVDQSIQPGDGGYGIILDFSAFKSLDDGAGDSKIACEHPGEPAIGHRCPNPDCALNPKRPHQTAITAYASGTYLVNPKSTNDARTFRGRTGATRPGPGEPAFYEEFMSVSDQYLLRAGLAFTNVTKHPKLTLSLGARLEGVPVRDLIGDSLGFRRPGYAVSIEPAMVYSLSKRETISVAIPFAIQRNREQSEADKRATEVSGTYRQGDAAFADYFVQAAYTRRF